MSPSHFRRLTLSCGRHRDTTVFVRTGFSLLRLQLAVNQNAAKVGEGVRFFTRGLRMLGSDVTNGGQLFYRAALGKFFLCLCVCVRREEGVGGGHVLSRLV